MQYVEGSREEYMLRVIERSDDRRGEIALSGARVSEMSD